MSVLSVTASREASSQITTLARGRTLSRRIATALMLSGWVALVLGQAQGILLARPDLLSLPVSIRGNEAVVATLGLLIVGLVSGAIAGLLLRGSHGVVRLAVALFDVLVGLITLEIVHGILGGMSLRAALLADGSLMQIAHFGAGAAGALVGIQTGRAPAALPMPVAPQRRSRRGRQRSQDGNRRRSRRQPAAAAAVASGEAGGRVQVPATPPRKARVGKWGFARRKIHLERDRMDVCPYCLEEVKPRDPRGRVVCSICGTPHHADCWAITGKCEVPHLQT